MGDRLGNTATAEPVDGVSNMAPHSGRALTCRRQDPLMSPHIHSHVATHRRPESDVKRHPHRVLALMTIDVGGPLSNQYKQTKMASAISHAIGSRISYFGRFW
jgi:hypothetical protein